MKPSSLSACGSRSSQSARSSRLASRASFEAAAQKLVSPLSFTAPKRRERGVDDLRDRGQMLHRAVMEELSEPSALFLLGENSLRESRSLGVVGQSIIASRSAMATAWVRVSASSFARM